LYLVEDQQDALLVGNSPQALQETVWRQDHATFALHRLDHDAAGFVIDELFNSGQVAVGSVDKPCH
jgi:hypothetical protein